MRKAPKSKPWKERTVDALVIEDEASFKRIPLYASLKEVLKESRYTFRVLSKGDDSWNRALFLNLTFWDPKGGGDVLAEPSLPADVVAHVAWHHLASKALAKGGTQSPSAEALALGESIASAFDLYLVGQLLARAPRSAFLESQVTAMAEVADAAGLTPAKFGALLESVADDPETAFEQLRELLFDTTVALGRTNSMSDAILVLKNASKHRFGPLLHHYELSNWVLYARTYAKGEKKNDKRVREIDRALRKADSPLGWLVSEWMSGSAG